MMIMMLGVTTERCGHRRVYDEQGHCRTVKLNTVIEYDWNTRL
jgi:hypothetical protein